MTVPLTPEVILSRLTPGLRSALRGVEADFCTLGCSESYAERLSVRKSTRPALTRRRITAGGKQFALTEVGAAVRALMPEVR